MATVINKRENDFDFHHEGEKHHIPAGKAGANGFQASETVIDDKVLDAARKNPVVEAWFDSGALEVKKAEKKAESKAESK